MIGAFPLLRTVPLFQSRDLDDLSVALNEDDDGPDGATFNRPTEFRPNRQDHHSHAADSR